MKNLSLGLLLATSLFSYSSFALADIDCTNAAAQINAPKKDPFAASPWDNINWFTQNLGIVQPQAVTAQGLFWPKNSALILDGIAYAITGDAPPVIKRSDLINALGQPQKQSQVVPLNKYHWTCANSGDVTAIADTSGNVLHFSFKVCTAPGPDSCTFGAGDTNALNTLTQTLGISSYS